MNKAKKIIKKWRVILLLLFLLFSFMAINPQFDAKGVSIRNIETNSAAAFAGMQNPPEGVSETSREIIKNINGNEIDDLSDYADVISNIKEDEKLTIQTNKGEYIFLKQNETGITVGKVATSNIKKGLELEGGTRVLLQPVNKITDDEHEDIIAVMRQRLSAYGLSDVNVKKANDLLGNRYILVEIAGATKQEVKDIVASQGKFEAKIGDTVVFIGGKEDITRVCRDDGTCSGVRSCSETKEGYVCTFEFQITLSERAAKKHAETTKDLEVNLSGSGKEYLSKSLDLYLDDIKVDTLQISADLKGREITDILISGPGSGTTEQEGVQNAVKQMNKLQTVLISGSLPTKLEIVKMDSISPTLGSQFVNNAFTIGLLAVIAVAIVIFVRYRNIKIALPMLGIGISEVVIIIGFAALIKYNLDLAAIAGIIAAVGTGVDDQIVIIDEVLSEKEQYYRLDQKIKRAFFIIMAAYATTFAAMMPLLKAGAGLLTGFALVTIAGITIGVFITRPAFASIIEVLLEE